jgi:uncharacterized membrane protein
MELNKKKGVAMFALSLMMVSIVLAAFGQIAMKSGMSQIEEINDFRELFNLNTFFDIFTNFYVLSGLLLYVVSLILWLGALSTLDVSYMYPLISSGYAITAILAFVFLKEDITLFRWVGIALVVIGCFMIVKS